MAEDTLISADGEQAGAAIEMADELNSQPSSEITITAADRHGGAIMQAVAAVGRARGGVYLTVNFPHHKLSAILKKNNIDSSKIKFVDAITATAMPHVKDHEACAYVQHPADLTYMDVQILEGLKGIEGERFLIIDSVSTLLLHNREETVARFMHSLATSVQSMGANTPIIALESGENAAAKRICDQFCDRVILVK